MAIRVTLPTIYMQSTKEIAIDYHKRGMINEAELLYSRLLSKSADPQLSYLLATIYYQKERYNWAEEQLKNSLPERGAPAYCCLGHVYMKLNQATKACYGYTEASKITPTYLEAWVGLATALIKSRNADKAFKVIETLRKLETNKHKINLLLGETYELIENYDAATKHYLLAHEANPADTNSQFYLGRVYYKRGKWDWAEESLIRAIQANPKHAEANLTLGQVYLSRNNHPKAEEFFRNAFSFDPNHIDTLLTLGKFFEMQNRPLEATCIYENAKQIQPNNPEILQRLGHALLNQRHEGPAEELFERVLKIEPDSIDTHTDLCQIRCPGTHYYEMLTYLHDWLKPATYFEIGIRSGRSLSFAKPPTLSVGVDCEPFVVYTFHAKTRIFPVTSDDFFKNYNLRECLDGKLVDMAFIDGSHLFPQVLRAFINTEKHSHQNTVILFHDTIPLNDMVSDPEQKTSFWTGDAWKIIPCLTKYRPDLKLATSASFPTGLGIVTKLDTNSTILEQKFDQIVEEHSDAKFSDIENPFAALNIIPNEFSHFKEFINSSRNQA